MKGQVCSQRKFASENKSNKPKYFSCLRPGLLVVREVDDEVGRAVPGLLAKLVREQYRSSSAVFIGVTSSGAETK